MGPLVLVACQVSIWGCGRGGLRKIVFSRKPAARLGEVFFANKVSLGGLGAERS